MNDNCRIGLHSFNDWRDVDKGLQQERTCRACKLVERRPFEPDPKPPYDPYADLR